MSRQEPAPLDHQELARELPRLDLDVLEVSPVAEEGRLAVAVLEVLIDLAVVGLEEMEVTQRARVGQVRDGEAALALVGAPQGDLLPLLILVPREGNAGR